MSTFILRPGLRVAVIGHTAHGKTALVAALARHAASRPFGGRTKPLDRPTEESGHHRAPPLRHGTHFIESRAREYTTVDVVGRPQYLRHAGVMTSCVDACVLVVSAVEGSMRQTRAHAMLARQHTSGPAVVFINRCDEVTDLDQLDLAEMEAREALIDAGFDGDAVTVVRGAAAPPHAQEALWTQTLDDVLDALDRDLIDAPRALDAPLFATVMHRWNRVTTPAGRVIEVSVRRGALRVGTDVFVLDRYGVADLSRVRSIHAFGAPTQRLEAGSIGTAMLVLGATRAFGRRRFPRMGDTLFEQPPTLTNRVVARVTLVATSRGGRRTPATNGHEAQVWLSGRELRCRMVLPAGVARIAPGETRDDVTLELARPTFVEVGATFAMRDGSDGDRVTSAAGAPIRTGCFATGTVRSIGPSANP
jgi:elongation factor Tu